MKDDTLLSRYVNHSTNFRGQPLKVSVVYARVEAYRTAVVVNTTVVMHTWTITKSTEKKIGEINATSDFEKYPRSNTPQNNCSSAT